MLGSVIIFPLDPAPESVQPPIEVVALLVFHNSNHSSTDDRVEPAHATSPITTVGLVVAAAASGARNGLRVSKIASEAHKTGRTDGVCLGIVLGLFFFYRCRFF